jgi:hypothetical protein
VPREVRSTCKRIWKAKIHHCISINMIIIIKHQVDITLQQQTMKR